MINGATKYPFIPRSRAKLLVGQFWSLPLPGGDIACGRILGLPGAVRSKEARLLVVGIHAWVGKVRPRLSDIRGKRIMVRGIVHVSAMKENLCKVWGRRSLAADGLPLSLGAKGSLRQWSADGLRRVAGKAIRGLR